MSSPYALTVFWLLGMFAYAASYYHSNVHGNPKAPSFWGWITQLDVISTKVIGIAALEMWSHSWQTPGIEWFENLLPHKPFSGFVFGFFCDVVALQVRRIVKQKFGADMPGESKQPESQ